jgi:hypothetical protein
MMFAGAQAYSGRCFLSPQWQLPGLSEGILDADWDKLLPVALWEIYD